MKLKKLERRNQDFLQKFTLAGMHDRIAYPMCQL